MFINPMKQPAGPSDNIRDPGKEEITMAFFNSAVGVLQTLVAALGAGLGIWGAINLLLSHPYFGCSNINMTYSCRVFLDII